ncbi:serine hydrolase [Flavobacterium sp. ASW18X]|uniref:serine hydrolase domain-containing protein n=1 Tax=Flavobacterium sp. ASW18X TaxID=2572595 RepID=UPI00197A8B74|nr:serine hydrolase domain-containing protein [Flavobacterium sp. ASW18X]
MKHTVLVVLVAIVGCTKKPDKRMEFKALIDSAMVKMVNKPLINSGSIAIYHKGKAYIGHYGELEKGKLKPPSDETIYEIGSLSKVLTGTLIANAVLENKLSIEDEVVTYLDKEYPKLVEQTPPIKLKHLLTHSSGLPNMLPLELNPVLEDFLNHETPLRINKILSNYNKTHFLEDLYLIKTDINPGLQYSYSSMGTELTAHILEKEYQTTYEDLLVTFLTDEIGMNSTKISLKKDELRHLAVGYHTDNRNIAPVMPRLPWGASGNVKSTVVDMMKFIKFQLKNNSVVKESHKSLVQFDNEFGLSYFWNINSSDKKLGTYYFHHGGVPRSQCYIYVIPKHDLAAFIITNQSGKDTSGKMEEALKEIFDGLIN